MELYDWRQVDEPKLELMYGAQKQEVQQHVLTEEHFLLSVFVPFCAVVTQDCFISKSSPKVALAY